MPDRRSISSSAPAAASRRIVSLDQFRGYTVLGMFVVNFIGAFTIVPAIFKHHNTYCSYADTIMPQFFFAVGFAFRLTFLRRATTMGRGRLYRRVVRRGLELILLGAVLYLYSPVIDAWSKPPSDVWQTIVHMMERDLFQTLVHIGVTTFWILPVIGARPWVRIAFALGSAALHVWLSQRFYYHWVMDFPGIDGGPLGFLTWTVPTLAGTLAYDVVAAVPRPRAARRLAAWGAGLMVLGYALSCLNLVTPPNEYSGGGLRTVLLEPPMVLPTRPVNLWTMSQRAGTVSYLTFGAGLSMALYALFVWASDIRGFQVGVFRTLGTNALSGYVIHMVLAEIIKPYVPKDSPPAIVLAALLVFLALCYAAVRLLEWRGIYLRL